jgi:carbonic anhydrase/acetyltransferase-like protein (isoleucine patch superfamily)
MSSWKKYGGINHFEQLTNINSTNLVVDHLSLRFPYEGIFSICGELIVSGEAYLDNNLSILGNIYNEQNVFISNQLYVKGDVDLSANLTVFGNTYHYNPLYLIGNSGKGSNYFVGDTIGVGMNKQNPEAIFDIYGNRPEILNVLSNQSYTRNILARNNLNYGITLNSNTVSSTINFYHKDIPINSINDNGNGGGQIKYEPNGNMTINVTNNLKVLSKMVISDRIDQLSNSVDGETLTIYDNPNGIFLPDIYNNSSIYYGNSLSLISTNTNSTTFLNIITPDQMGWKWGGGVFPNDTMRNMSTMGYNDENNKYVPSQTIISGNSLVKNRSTIGINTYSPKTENYIMDINGPISIQHQEIHLIQNVNYEINSISFSSQYQYRDYGIAIGKSNTVNNEYNYNYYYLITNDGGKTWKEIQLIYKNTISNVNFKAFYYNPQNILISSNLGYVFYMNDGINWNFISNAFPITQPSIYITTINSAIRTFLAYPKEKNDIENKSKSIIYYFDNYSTNNINFQTTNDIYCMHGYINYLFAAGNNYIVVYDISLNINILHENTNNYTYNAIYTLDGINTIAVGYDIISYTKNNGLNWTHITNIPVNFNDIYILDKLQAVTVGNYGMIYYSIDGYKTWNEMTIQQINGMGNGNNIINSNTNITSIKMMSSDIFILSCVNQTFNPTNNQTGNTNLFYLYFPDIFNRENRKSLLDIYGNMVISGDINIIDDGKIQTTNDTFYLLNKNANSVYFAGEANNIYIGNSIVGGTTYLYHQLDVSDNTYLHKNIVIDGIQTIQNTTNTIGLNTGALQVAGGISVNKNARIGGNVQIDGILNIQGGFDICGNVIIGYNPNINKFTVNAKSFFNNDVSMNNNLYVMRDVSFNNNAFINNNAIINNNLFVANNVDISNNTIIRNDLLVKNSSLIENKLIVYNDVSFNHHLFVGYDTSLNRNLYVGNNAYFNKDIYVNNNEWINGNAYIVGDISLNGNQKIANNLNIGGNAELNGQLIIHGNTTVGDAANNELIVNSQSTFSSDMTVNGNINITNNTNITGSQTTLNSTNTTIGSSPLYKLTVNSKSNFNSVVDMVDVNMQKLTSPNTYTNYLYSYDISTIYIGSNATNIVIGGPATTIYYQNKNNPTVNSASVGDNTASKYFTLNSVNAISTGNSGINISNSISTYAGLLLMSSDNKQVKFKSPASANVVGINLYDLSVNLSKNTNGILILKNYNSEPIVQSGVNPPSITHMIDVSPFDISNVLQRSIVESTSTKQVITTDINIKGNVNTYDLNINGNLSHSNGWITQF